MKTFFIINCMLELKSQPRIVAPSVNKTQRGFVFLLSLPSQRERMDGTKSSCSSIFA